MGLRADLLLLRSQPPQMALGPYADVATRGFHDVDVGGGASWLIPASVDFPLVLSAGAFARDGQGRSWQPGVEGTLFGGARSYNFHSAYAMTNGIFVQTRWLPSTPSEMDVVVGVQVDLEVLALPFLFAVEALRH